MKNETWHRTTVLCVRKDKSVIIGADGQVSLGHSIMKSSANKLRRLDNDSVLAGFAGSAADGLTLLDRLEDKLSTYPQQLLRSCVELAKDWRTDKYLKRLEAMLIVADKKVTLLLSGSGDVLEPEDGIAAIGSGGNYAIAAARAMVATTKLSSENVVKKALEIASDICIYTNSNIRMEKLEW